ncbi:MAG: stage V sporulation protein B [Carboxydocellales bacterium]
MGTAVLVAASLFNRILGFMYQILIIDLIGAKGIGLYNMVFPIYILAIVIASAGIPLAVSKFVSAEAGRNNLTGARQILRLSILFMLCTGAVCTLLLYWLSPYLKTNIFPNPASYIVFRTLLPGILMICISSAFRGYFQGLMQMTPTALSLVVDQIVRVCSGLFLARLLLPWGIAYGAMGSALGLILGELAGLLTIIIIYKRFNTKARLRNSAVNYNQGILLMEMLQFSVPVTLSRIVATIILSMEATMIPKLLILAGASLDEATSMYGQLTGMAMPILAIPSVLTSSLATAMVPAVSEAASAKQNRLMSERIGESLKMTICAGLPAVVVFLLIPQQLTELLFHNPQAGQALRVLAIGGLFYYLQQTTTGILQGLGQARLPLRNLIIASVLELIGLSLLVGIPGLGLVGASLAINISFIVVAVLNLINIANLVGIMVSLKKLIIIPIAASLALAFTLMFSYQYIFLPSLGSSWSTIFALGVSGSVYCGLLLLTGVINTRNFRRLNFSKRIWK